MKKIFFVLLFCLLCIGLLMLNLLAGPLL